MGCRTVLFFLLLSACERREPPTWDAGGYAISAAQATPVSPTSPSPPNAPPLPSSPEASPTSASPAASAAASAGPVPATGPDPGTLPQTHDVPEASGPAFEQHAMALFSAIKDDNADLALPFFFPLTAYQQVKDVNNPERDWKLRLVAAYKRDIHDLHLKMGKNASRATFVGLTVPSRGGRWVEPGEEYNKLGYHRVFGSKLRYEAGGRTHDIDVKSLISWRGVWYVVHLSGFK